MPTWVSTILVAAAAVILLIGLVVAIRDLWRPAPAVSSRSLRLLEASYAHEGLPQEQSGSRDAARGAERDPPAIAA